MFAATAALRPTDEATAYIVRWQGHAAVLRNESGPPPLP